MVKIMGTDIHIQFEVFQDNQWKYLGKKEPNKYHTEPDDGESEFSYENELFYENRNYDAFAILANVRNGRGFAGVKTGDGFNIISEPKGFPTDMSPEVADWAERVEHTPSWLTLKELIDFNWNQTTRHEGWMKLDIYKNWDKTKSPDDYCGGVSGRNIEHILMIEADQLLKDPSKIDPKKEYYVNISFNESYIESFGSYYTELIPKMKEVAPNNDPSKIRMVFYFDS
jgi:hypothetical protein